MVLKGLATYLAMSSAIFSVLDGGVAAARFSAALTLAMNYASTWKMR